MLHPDEIMRPAPHFAAALIAAFAWNVAAQPGLRAEAAVRARQGELAERRGDLPEARRLLEESARLGGPPSVFRSLARVLEAAGDLRAAGEAWSRYVALATDAPDREEAAARQERLRRTLGSLLVEVRPASAGRVARVWVDRDAPRPYPAGGLRAVVEGDTHRVRVEAPGWVTWEAMVTTGYGVAHAERVEMREETRDR